MTVGGMGFIPERLLMMMMIHSSGIADRAAYGLQSRHCICCCTRQRVTLILCPLCVSYSGPGSVGLPASSHKYWGCIGMGVGYLALININRQAGPTWLNCYSQYRHSHPAQVAPG